MHGYPAHARVRGEIENCDCNDTTYTVRPRIISAQEMISDQNEYLEMQFRRMEAENEKLVLDLASNQSKTATSIVELRKVISKISHSNSDALKQAADQSRQREEKILAEVRKAFNLFDGLSKELISVTQKSSANTKSIVDLVGRSNSKLSSIQKMVQINSKSLSKNTKQHSEIAILIEEQSERTEGMFRAMEQDLEAIRQRISKLEKDELKRQK